MTVLEATGLAGAYGAETVVTGVDLTLEAGRCLAILGPNGAGKSTLLRLLAGVLPATAGEVTLLGTPLTRLRRREVAQRLAFVPQSVDFTFRLTVLETVQQGRACHLGPWRPPAPADHAAVDRALTQVHLEDKSRVPVPNLSGGERQRVLLARALATEPRVLLLDEPAAALDVASQLELVAIVRERLAQGVAAAVVLHDWNLALEMADDLLVLSHGHVHAQGVAAEVVSPELFDTVFGVVVEVREVNGRNLVVPLSLSRRGALPPPRGRC